MEKLMHWLHSKPFTTYITALVFLAPLLFLGTFNSHDWGDDFAQYIHQAANIVHGVPQSESGFVYSQENYIGPQSYPGGFPLMLAPVYALAGNSMRGFIVFISLIYIALGLLIVAYYRRYFPGVVALALMLIYVYNPQMILFKREVMSDLPFTMLLAANFIIYEKWKCNKTGTAILLAVLAGFMITVRPAGIVFVDAILVDLFISWFRKRRERKFPWAAMLTLIIVPIGIYFIINNIWLKIPSGGSLRDYMTFYFSGGFWDSIPRNFERYVDVFRYQYVPESGFLRGFSLIFGSAVLAFAAVGFIKRINSGIQAVDWFFIFYAGMLLVFPNYDSAFRLTVPVGFILLFYAATGMREIAFLKQLPAWQKALGTIFVAGILYLPGIISIYQWSFNTLDGPQKKESVDTFNFVQTNVSPDSVVVFAKPRALALYGGCRSMADPLSGDPTKVHVQLLNNHAAYILTNRTLTAEPMLRYIRMMGPRLEKIFENRNFTLYRISRAAPH